MHDLRYGTIDKHLPLDPRVRDNIREQLLLKPDPDRADKLDRLMHRLGFYKTKATGEGGGTSMAIPPVAQYFVMFCRFASLKCIVHCAHCCVWL